VPFQVAGIRISNRAPCSVPVHVAEVHDELVLEVAPGELEQVEALVREGMGGAVPLTVPLDVSVGVGRTWEDAGH
jgi:DNA polymerase I-like protein with 3'-5' exonuclease and polymerase domains